MIASQNDDNDRVKVCSSLSVVVECYQWWRAARPSVMCGAGGVALTSMI